MKYTIYKNDVGQLMAMEGHCEFDGVVSKCVDMSVSMEFFVEACAHKQFVINNLRAENARLREALEFYADISVWGNGCAAIDPCDTYTCDRGVLRGGKHAIEALRGDITPDKGES
jgi:NADH:ubiquinone oxidoreductase subunit E